MKKYKYLSYIFLALAILLSNVMCATVAYKYSYMVWGIREGFSAPASVAFVFAVPYAAGIAICAAIAWVFHKKYRNSM